MDAPLSPAPDLLAILKASIAEQRAAAARSLPAGPARCGDHGQHAWLRGEIRHGVHYVRRIQDGGYLLTCECGARAREDHEGKHWSESGYGPPPPVPAVAAEAA